MSILCLKAHGWRKSPAKSKNWSCPGCHRGYWGSDAPLPDPFLLTEACRRHLPRASTTYTGTAADLGTAGPSWMPNPSTGASSSGPRDPPPPPPGPFPGQQEQQCPPLPPPPCMGPQCAGGWQVCQSCEMLQRCALPPAAALTVERPLVRSVAQCVMSLNNAPQRDLPPWLLGVTTDTLRTQQHVQNWRFDDCGNGAGSALVLIMLRPSVYGHPDVPPLRILGLPPPPFLIAVTNQHPRSGVGHDNNRTNLVESLLGFWHERAGHGGPDSERALALANQVQDLWWWARQFMLVRGLVRWPVWQICRALLASEANELLP